MNTIPNALALQHSLLLSLSPIPQLHSGNSWLAATSLNNCIVFYGSPTTARLPKNSFENKLSFNHLVLQMPPVETLNTHPGSALVVDYESIFHEPS